MHALYVYTIHTHIREEFTPLAAAFIIAKQLVRPLDLTHTTTVSGQQYISFLSLTWALIADMDFESEKYRCCGGARFEMAAIARIANVR
jgi:sphingosine kinase